MNKGVSVIVWPDGYFNLAHNVTEEEHALRVAAARGHINDGFSPYPRLSETTGEEAGDE